MGVRAVKVCVTGGSGFIGRFFVERLLDEGHEVVILDLVKPDWKIGSATYIRGDVRDMEALLLAIDGCRAVIHLAAAHHDFGIERDTFFSVNKRGAKLICGAMDECRCRFVCFYSTVAVYGDAPEPHREDMACKPNSPYGESKLAGEAIFRKWTEKGDGRRCLVVRPAVTFGPRNFANMYTLIDQIARRRFLVVGHGRNIKGLSYIENILEATFYLWNRDDRPAFDLINYVDKPDLTSMEITRTVYAALGKNMPSMRWPMWLVRVMAIPFDLVIAATGKNLPISSARVKKMYAVQTKFEADRIAAAGFEPPVPLKEGIRRMVEWYQREGRELDNEWHLPPRDTVPLHRPRRAAV
jgi:nucleoside-diphosphate-sugar epimerase